MIKTCILIIAKLIVNGNECIEHLKILISIGIRLGYDGINLHIIVILITFWIKSRLIIMIKKENKLIKLQTKSQLSI